MHLLFKVKYIFKLFRSLGVEIKVITTTITIISVLSAAAAMTPMIGGFAIVSAALVAVNPINHLVEVRSTNGNIIARLQLSTVWPTKGGVTQEFGVDNSPYEPYHTGIDVANKTGTPITSFMEGDVVKVSEDKLCGKSVTISHGNSISSYYCHMSETKAVVKQKVKPGEVIGLVGQTGGATGPHVHFGVRVQNINVNPRVFMVGEPQKP